MLVYLEGTHAHHDTFAGQCLSQCFHLREFTAPDVQLSDLSTSLKLVGLPRKPLVTPTVGP